MLPHRTRQQTRMDPTTGEKLDQAREARKILWREESRIEEDHLTAGQAFKRKYLRSVDTHNDEIREDNARLLAALFWKFKLYQYIVVDREEAMLEHLLSEFDHHVTKFAGPFSRGPKLGEVPEEDVREYFQARRAQVCTDLAELHTQFRAAQRDTGTWSETIISYKALAL